METRPQFPTPHPDVNRLLQALGAGVQHTLGDYFTGMYLHGSLALGDFALDRSDIDYLVVTNGPLPSDRYLALQALHAAFAVSGLPWRTNYEGSYIPARDIRHHRPSEAFYPAVQVDGHFGRERHGSDWIIQRHILREHGITLAGPDPRELIDPVTSEQLRAAVQQSLREWWQPQLDDPCRLHSSEYQAYAVLTMCRASYTFRLGRVASKSEAARWAQANLVPAWSDLIESLCPGVGGLS